MDYLHRQLNKMRGRGWTRTIDPLINISRSCY